MLALAACGRDSLADYAGRGDLAKVRSLVSQGADVNTKYAVGATALHLAARNGQIEVARFLLEKGAKPCGLGSRDTLRLEACMPLHGHEITDDIDPLTAELGWAVFIGTPKGHNAFWDIYNNATKSDAWYAGFMRKGIGTDYGLIRLDRHTGQLRDQTARLVYLFSIH